MLYEAQLICCNESMNYTHCRRCGGLLDIKDKGYLVCVSCGKKIYVSPRPTVSAIIENEKGELLLVVRGVDPGKGQLDTPGGFVDLDETAEEAFVREMKEELGVLVKNPQLLFSYVEDYDYDGETIPLVAICVRGEIESGELKPADDVSGYEWMDMTRIPFDRFAFDGMKGAVKKYINNYRDA